MFAHVPVMVQEVMGFLNPQPRKRYLDGTLGGGGHTERFLIDSVPDGEVLGLDLDEDAIVAARNRLSSFGSRVIIRQGNFAEAAGILTEIGWQQVDGIVLDLGVSSHQFESAERGFSFQVNARLDMRMDRRQSLDACEIVNNSPVAELRRILREYGEEPQARRIALAIAAARHERVIQSTSDLAAIVTGITKGRRRGHHPATQTFQALRIAVNKELENLSSFLEEGYGILGSNGRMVIISFHSLEDRLVKTAFRRWSRDCICPPTAPRCRCGWSRKVRLLTRRPVIPSANEIKSNPRARSAKLRAVERI